MGPNAPTSRYRPSGTIASMAAGVRLSLPLLLLGAVVLGACGSDSPEPEPATTVLTEPAPLTSDTTGYSDNPCFKFPTEVLRLQNDYLQALKGVAGADPNVYGARARAILDEARAWGCEDPKGLTMFFGGSLPPP